MPNSTEVVAQQPVAARVYERYTQLEQAIQGDAEIQPIFEELREAFGQYALSTGLGPNTHDEAAYESTRDILADFPNYKPLADLTEKLHNLVADKQMARGTAADIEGTTPLDTALGNAMWAQEAFVLGGPLWGGTDW